MSEQASKGDTHRARVNANGASERARARYSSIFILSRSSAIFACCRSRYCHRCRRRRRRRRCCRLHTDRARVRLYTYWCCCTEWIYSLRSFGVRCVFYNYLNKSESMNSKTQCSVLGYLGVCVCSRSRSLHAPRALSLSFPPSRPFTARNTERTHKRNKKISLAFRPVWDIKSIQTLLFVWAAHTLVHRYVFISFAVVFFL